MKLSYSKTQKIGMLLIILLLFLMSGVILIRDGSTISLLENITKIYNPIYQDLSEINQQFLFAGFQFFRYDDDIEKQKMETKKSLDEIKQLLSAFYNSLQQEKEQHHSIGGLTAIYQKTQTTYRRFLTAYYAYYSNIYTRDRSYTYSLGAKRELENVITQSIVDASSILNQFNKSHAALLAHEIDQLTQSLFILLSFIFFLLLVTIMIIFMLAKILNQSIKKIRDNAQKISEGNFDEPLQEFANDNVGVLARMLDKMRVNLKSYIENLQEEIKTRKKTEEKITYLAYHDELTGLPNRIYFNRVLEREIERAKRHNLFLAIMFLDIDNFKTVNDTYGHDIGDLLIQATAKRLKENLRTEDIISRISGDEFMILLSGLQDPNEAAFIGQKLINSFSKSFILQSIEFRITVSMGFSIFPLTSKNPDELLKLADIAMYRAKETGRNNCQNYDKELDKLHKEQLEIYNKLPFALERNEFYLAYQPIIDVSDNKIVGMEVLLRWLLPSKGLILPDTFLSIAEKSSIFPQLGFWIIDEAFKQLKKWQNLFDLSENYLSINLSAIQLETEKINQHIFNSAGNLKVNPKNIGFEITESSIMTNLDRSKKILKDLHRHGFKLLIDDFGTGFSSFARLKELDITTLKIDKSFIDDIGQNEMGERIIKSIIALAETLGLSTIAEGVETKEQAEFLLKNQCPIVQGFYYSQPLKVDEMTEYLKTHL